MRPPARPLLALLLLAALASVAAAPAATTTDTEAPRFRSFLPDWRHESQDVYVSAYPDDRNRGGSDIVGVTVTVDGVAYSPPAEDGAYDEPFEGVESLLGADATGDLLEVCGWATDAAGNSSAPTCYDVDTTDNTPPYVTSRPWTSPATPDLAEEITLRATLEDQHSLLASATYTIDDGEHRPMAALDGAFDESQESVGANIGALAAGTHRLCVFGKDEHGNGDTTDLSRPVGDDDSPPFHCTDVEVADRRAPSITDLVATPSAPAFGEEVVLRFTADDREAGGSDLQGATLTIDGDRQGAVSHGGSGSGPVAHYRIEVDGFPEIGAHELCVDVKDVAGNRSPASCVTVEVTDRSARGTLTTESFARPEAHLGPDATFTIDGTQSPDGSVDGGFTFADTGLEFVADLPATAEFDGDATDHTLRASGQGRLNGVLTCAYELTLVDGAQDDHDQRDTLFLTVTCDGQVVLDGAAPARDGDVEIRA